MSKVILISGGSRGIGRATAILAGKRGWSVGVNYLGNQAAAARTAADVKDAGGKAIAIKGDIAAEEDVIAMFDATEEAFGKLDGFVSSAGIVAAPACQLADMTADRLKRIFDINVYGAFLGAREAARRLSKKRGGNGGSIVNLSSAVSRLGAPGEYVDYAGSKGAVDSLTLGLGRELAQEGVRVNAVRPGIIDTEIHASGGRPDRAKTAGPATPMGRAGTAEEVAEAIVWLLSDASSYVNSAIIDVTGGR